LPGTAQGIARRTRIGIDGILLLRHGLPACHAAQRHYGSGKGHGTKGKA
jgi:hypothetical protein